MDQYIGTKIVNAIPDKDVLGREGYKVVYTDGYVSWSPKEAFEEAYRRTDGLPFGLAIEAMKKGLKVCRSGWNGKGMYLYYVPAAHYTAKTDAAEQEFGIGGMVPYQAYIAMRTVNATVVPWLASQTDMLADDWVILENNHG